MLRSPRGCIPFSLVGRPCDSALAVGETSGLLSP